MGRVEVREGNIVFRNLHGARQDGRVLVIFHCGLGNRVQFTSENRCC